MTIARNKIVNLSVTRWYHCLSRCVRQGSLLFPRRKEWIEKRIELLAEIFSVSVGSYSVLSNHFHVMIRVDPEESKRWKREEVVRRWFEIHPPKGYSKMDDSQKLQEVDELVRNEIRVEELRNRLTSLSWFMKELKEPLSVKANREDGCKGAFWESRFKSIAVCGRDAKLANSVYIDLNPVAAGIAKTPEESDFTSIKRRVKHLIQKNAVRFLRSVERGTVESSIAMGNVEDDLWLVPIDDRRMAPKNRSKREGLVPTFSIANYLKLVESTGRMTRDRKKSIDPEAKDIFDRLEDRVEAWTSWFDMVKDGNDFRGNFMALDETSRRNAIKGFGSKKHRLSVLKTTSLKKE